MKPFAYVRAGTAESAVQSSVGNSRFIAGGTNLIDLMKLEVECPDQVIDVTRIDLAGIHRAVDGSLNVGALATNTALAQDPTVRREFPIISRALLSGASPQIRNVATFAGNLLQRTRCSYFYDTDSPCNKREPGTGCGALQGLNRDHALFGGSEHCIATHPSDLAVALAVLEPVLDLRGPAGTRRMAFAHLHRLPETEPQRDTHLLPGELMIGATIPPNHFARHSVYLKLRDRATYAFALISVAVGLDLQDGLINEARIALGGVAHKPWRATQAEAHLKGSRVDDLTFTAAAELAVTGAQAREHNGYKIELARRAVKRALSMASKGGGVP